MKERILVLGGGFAGLWSALAAARAREVFDADLEIVLLNDTPWHSIRVRNYEVDLSDTRVALDDVLGPVDVHRLQGTVTAIDVRNRRVDYAVDGVARSIGYDRLVFALGSRLRRSPASRNMASTSIPMTGRCGSTVILPI
jgi:NADH dehydrogenase